MTSEAESKLLEERRRSPMDQLPPPASSNKPLTPFSIEDILNKPSMKRKRFQSPAQQFPRGAALPAAGLLSQSSPLCALEELASKTFQGLDVSVLQAAEGRDGLTIFGQRNTPKRRRKSRTAFTNHQIYELEKRFLYQKYLSPADRDQIAQQLALTNAQVITWFQNRRAKLKRDLEEMKADVESAKAAGTATLAELQCAVGGLGLEAGSRDQMPCRSPQAPHHHSSSRPASPSSPAVSQCEDRLSSRCCSEDEEIQVDE
ncbi:transcription factor LBX1a [Cololabis saira]|uniref:transcription factor LBX1a n=1 Tax=Cololabis saira TaxID=129043 RepID=UPI002AD3B17E|nr:transcription factor LBX1a [Cololabis saira]